MYSISNRKYINKGRLLDKTDVLDIGGFLVATKHKVFQVQGNPVRKIRVISKDLAHPLVHEVVTRKYDQLISILAELMVEEDDDGETCREALNQIERFRIQVKNKYRYYIRKQELEKMSRKLSKIQKSLQMKLFMIQNSYLRQVESSRGGR